MEYRLIAYFAGYLASKFQKKKNRIATTVKIIYLLIKIRNEKTQILLINKNDISFDRAGGLKAPSFSLNKIINHAKTFLEKFNIKKNKVQIDI